MPKGVYARKPKADKLQGRQLDKILHVQQAPVVVETDDEIEARLTDRFEILGEMTDLAIAGDVRAMVVSGPAGLGKSFTVEAKLEAADPSALDHTIVKGYVRAPGLYKLLYAHRNRGQVLVFDDADAIFFDDTALNLLKAACDTTERRVISYITENGLIDEETAERLPKSFQFDGTIIFITNCDFFNMIDKGNKLKPHLEALISRSYYIDMGMKNVRDYLIRIRQVVKQGLFADLNMSSQECSDVVKFIEDNHKSLTELSLRMARKIAILRKKYDGWERMARVTCVRP